MQHPVWDNWTMVREYLHNIIRLHAIAGLVHGVHTLHAAITRFARKVTTSATTRKLLIFVVVIILISGSLLWLTTHGYIPKFLEWIRTVGFLGNVMMVFVYILLAFPFAVGYTPMALASGFCFGVLYGTITVSAGSMAGATVIYLLCKTTWKREIEKYVHKKPALRAIAEAVKKEGAKIIFLGRLTPIPFGVQNTIYSVSQIPFRVYFTATFLGLLPEQIMYAYMGHKMINLSEVMAGRQSMDNTQKAMFAAEILLIVLLVAFITRIVRKALADALNSDAPPTGPLLVEVKVDEHEQD
eukprot:Colp12_sorted_trinity150504_noHs@4056